MKNAKDSMFFVFLISFPRSAWECSPDAPRPDVKRVSNSLYVPTRSVGTRLTWERDIRVHSWRKKSATNAHGFSTNKITRINYFIRVLQFVRHSCSFVAKISQHFLNLFYSLRKLLFCPGEFDLHGNRSAHNAVGFRQVCAAVIRAIIK